MGPACSGRTGERGNGCTSERVYGCTRDAAVAGNTGRCGIDGQQGQCGHDGPGYRHFRHLHRASFVTCAGFLDSDHRLRPVVSILDKLCSNLERVRPKVERRAEATASLHWPPLGRGGSQFQSTGDKKPRTRSIDETDIFRPRPCPGEICPAVRSRARCFGISPRYLCDEQEICMSSACPPQ